MWSTEGLEKKLRIATDKFAAPHAWAGITERVRRAADELAISGAVECDQPQRRRRSRAGPLGCVERAVIRHEGHAVRVDESLGVHGVPVPACASWRRNPGGCERQECVERVIARVTLTGRPLLRFKDE